MRVAFRADASTEIGSGHVMRCMTLAAALRREGATIVFLCKRLPDHLHARLAAEGFELHLLPDPAWEPPGARLAHAGWLGTSQAADARDTAAALDGTVVDWLVVDHYALDQEWETALRSRSRHLMVIDDLADRTHACDLLLDQNFRMEYTGRYDGLVPPRCIMLQGPSYALLQPDYEGLRAETVPRRTVRRLLVYFGGSIFTDFAAEVVKAILARGFPALEIDVVAGKYLKHSDIAATASAAGRVRIHGHVPSLAHLIGASDLAIGAIGATSWERLCLGLPTIAVTLAANQVTVAGELAAARLIRLLGDISEVSPDRIADEFAAIAGSGELEAWSRRCMDVCDGAGTGRVVECMLRLREAAGNDMERLSVARRLASGGLGRGISR